MVNLSPSIGKIAGIEIQLDWSFLLLLVFALLISLYAFAVFVVLFVCVLLHELAHSITSNRYHIKAKKIVLLPIGGISMIDFESVKPNTELKISLAGPLANIAISIFVGAFIPLAPAGSISQALVFVSEINLLLGLFNLLPAFPLDGGRLLRAYLQKGRGRLRATELTVKASDVMLMLFMAGTVVFIAFSGYPLENSELLVLYNLIVAMFIYSGAQSELQDAYVKEYTSDLKVGDAMSGNYVKVSANATMHDLYNAMRTHRHPIALFEGGNDVKIVRLPSDRKKLMDISLLNKRVKAFGVKLQKISVNATLPKAINAMRQSDYGVMAAMDGRKLAGILLAQNVDTIVALHIAKRRREKTHKNI
jgi:Zn-dependent protease